ICFETHIGEQVCKGSQNDSPATLSGCFGRGHQEHNQAVSLSQRPPNQVVPLAGNLPGSCHEGTPREVATQSAPGEGCQIERGPSWAGNPPFFLAVGSWPNTVNENSRSRAAKGYFRVAQSSVAELKSERLKGKRPSYTTPEHCGRGLSTHLAQ